MYKKNENQYRQLVFKALVTLFFPLFLLFPACSGKKKSVAYEFTTLRRGTLERTVSSSGTINPVASVKVLPQMSGKVEKIHVDYNDPVTKGQILAELNTDMLKLKRDQQYASVIKARANFELQQLTYRSQEALAQKNLISEFELKSSKTNLDNQAADLAVAEANLKVIETEINQYAYIKSPIDGIVLDRRINIGDSVVDSSSSNSSNIFVLAENLKEMQIEASVGELDVASIEKGQSVRFTLESMSRRSFSGEVETLRMVPVVTNNVVSYTVIVKVENHDGSLLPGMTCAVDFIVERSVNTLTVSNASLRYQPTNLSADKISEMIFNASLENMSEEQKTAAIEANAKAKTENAGQANQNSGGLAGLMIPQGNQMRRMPGGDNRQASGQNRTQAPAVVWRNLWYFSENGKLAVMQVRTGISNGTLTEIFGPEDLEGKEVILREKI